MERIEPDDAIDRTEPEDATEASEPTDRNDPADITDPNENADAIDPMLRWLSTLNGARSDWMEVAGAKRSSTNAATRDRSGARRQEVGTADDHAGTWGNRVRARHDTAFDGSAATTLSAGGTRVGRMATGTVPPLRRALKAKSPSRRMEQELWDAGHRVVVGVDEVGRGSWAGPLTVGAAVIPSDRRVYKLRDSKMLTERERESLFDRIAEWCVSWSVGHATDRECDELGMSAAQRLAARRALEGLTVTPDQVLLDGNWDFVGGGITRRIVKGDARCLSISAASILAKVTRDRLMRAEAEHFPGYDFEHNKGYPCPRHKMALAGMGPTSIHRRSWVFMEHIPWTGCPRLTPGGQQSLFPPITP
jgi:ribonuclease HII